MVATFKNVLMNTVSYEAYHWEDLKAMEYDPNEAHDYLICQGFPSNIVQRILNDIKHATGVIVAIEEEEQDILLAFLDKYE